MKKILLCLFVTLAHCGFSQLHGTINQYMLNQGILNPGYMDVNNSFAGTAIMHRHWMSMNDGPLTLAINGYNNFTRNHGASVQILSDKVAGIKTLEAGAGYTYHAWINHSTAIGIGLRVSYNQQSITSDYLYFSAVPDPALQNLKTAGVNIGTGVSIQSENFDFGLSLPFLFHNSLGNQGNFYAVERNHFYSNIGYKIRFSDYFILYPTILAKAVNGAPLSVSFDTHVLIEQLLWLGGGVRTDGTFSFSAGVFLDKGLRINYSYEDSYFTNHLRLESSHEVSINYTRKLTKNPFTKQQHKRITNR